jgi:hypothetical protein
MRRRAGGGRMGEQAGKSAANAPSFSSPSFLPPPSRPFLAIATLGDAARPRRSAGPKGRA